jgi:putative nucleotidyltransferase with HDIG domain
MSLYRVKQFFWSLTAKIDDKDNRFIDKYLNSYEKQLFRSLAIYEQKHCIKVAKDVLKECESRNIKNEFLVKAALLHDIGKIYKKLNLAEKSIVVILDSISKGRLRRLKDIKKIDVYYNHAEKGYNILKNEGSYEEEFLYLIKNHHNDFIIGDKNLDILRNCDSNN